MSSIVPEKLAHPRWWPPSPHREEIVKILERGRAHLEARGHGQPPLLVYEDGGTMELPKVRYVNGQFTAVDGSEPERQTTRYLDVCGTVDEFERLLRERPPEATPENLRALLDDAGSMLARMEERRQQYARFAEEVNRLAERLRAIQGPDPQPAYETLQELAQRLQSGLPQGADEVERWCAEAESVRDIANRMEQTLYPYRDAAIELGALFAEIKGGRNWPAGRRAEASASPPPGDPA
jgi:hypothetical protein